MIGDGFRDPDMPSPSSLIDGIRVSIVLDDLHDIVIVLELVDDLPLSVRFLGDSKSLASDTYLRVISGDPTFNIMSQRLIFHRKPQILVRNDRLER